MQPKLYSSAHKSPWIKQTHTDLFPIHRSNRQNAIGKYFPYLPMAWSRSTKHVQRLDRAYLRVCRGMFRVCPANPALCAKPVFAEKFRQDFERLEMASRASACDVAGLSSRGWSPLGCPGSNISDRDAGGYWHVCFTWKSFVYFVTSFWSYLYTE